MPKRILDGEALWSSSKLEGCAEWAKPEYAWLYPLADGNGSFELTNLRVIHGKVAAIRPAWTIDQLAMTISEFRKNGLLFVWKQGGKIYGHWTGSEKVGRLPALSKRDRYQMLAPPVPKDLLLRYLQQYRDKVRTLSGQVLVLEGVLDLVLEEERSATAAQAEERPSHSERLPLSYQGLHLEVTERQDKVLAQGFPWVVNRQAEYASADSWLEANPERRPKKQNRFIDNWFRRIKSPEENKNGARQPSREEQRRERSEQAIENVVGRRSGLAERLRAGIPRDVDRGVGGSVHGLLGKPEKT